MVYSESLSWIPKGILYKTRHIFFTYLWRGNTDRKVLPWVRWDHIATSKALGGWGLKNIFLFSKSLAAKTGWRLISTNSLWIGVISQKYIVPRSILEWIKYPNKTQTGGSIIWKARISSFGIIGDGLALKVRNNGNICIGLDPWPGSVQRHFLQDNVLAYLDHQNICFLSQVMDINATNFWH